MTSDPVPFRCAPASLADLEPMAGTAPPEPRYLFIEDPGPWGSKAVEESRFPDEVKAHLAGLAGTRVQLIRRHGGSRVEGGRRVFVLDYTRSAPSLRTTVIADVEELLCDPSDLPTDDHDDHLWLVCTNGRRDVCCAEFGRPVARALSERWPEQTWETTHLGGHRFAATLLAAPSGITLGRLDPTTVVPTCEQILAGGHPWSLSRGRAGFPPAVQVAELAAREAGASSVHWRPPVRTGSDVETGGLTEVDLVVDGRPTTATVARRPGPARRQSCGGKPAKPTEVHEVVGVEVVSLAAVPRDPGA